MAPPTVPTAVLNAVAPDEMGKASGINFMAQRLGGVFAIAVSTAVFTARGHLGAPASVTSGFNRPSPPAPRSRYSPPLARQRSPPAQMSRSSNRPLPSYR